jgi:hypothetical protein
MLQLLLVLGLFVTLGTLGVVNLEQTENKLRGGIYYAAIVITIFVASASISCGNLLSFDVL